MKIEMSTLQLGKIGWK